MFNLSGSEIIVILLLALVVLGPEKLPDAIRRFSRTYAELKKMGSGFQTELKSALDEPMREMRETAEMVRDAADPDKIAAQAEAEAAAKQVAEPDEPTEGITDPSPTVAESTPPGAAATGVAAAAATAGAAGAIAGATDDAFDEVDDAPAAEHGDARRARTHDPDPGSDASPGHAPADSSGDAPADSSGDAPADSSGDAPADSSGDAPADSSGDAPPARPVNRIAAGNSSEAIAGASAAAESSNGSEPSGPAFHSAAPRHGRSETALDDGLARNDRDGDDATAIDPGDEPTEAAIDESSGEAATA